MTDPRINRQGTIREGRRGERLTARRFNEPIRAINRLVSGISQGQIIGRRSDRAVTVPAFIRMTIFSIGADTLLCQGIEDSSGFTAGSVYVAKPWELRRTPFDGESRNGISYTYSSNVAREADDGVDTENQVIVPSYVVGDEIVALRGLDGGTGVTITINGIETPVTLIDLNLGARAWAKEAA